MQKRKIDAIIYDLDGTIVFSEPVGAKALELTMKELGIAPRKDYDIYTLVFLPIDELLKNVFDDEETLKKAKIIWFNHYIDLAFEKKELQLAPNIKEVLTKLNEMEIPLAIATGSVYVLADLALEHFGIKDFFKTIITVEEVEKPKPDTQIFELAAKELNVKPRNCMIIGDTKFDIIPANKLGAVGVLYDSPHTPEKMKFVPEAKPDYVIKDHAETFSIIKELTN
ncbi:MAG: HAD family hydrolase [Candidatus Asgardarchaeia archaeon]